MTQYLIPSDDEFVEFIARTIARERLMDEASYILRIQIDDVEELEKRFDRMFDRVWSSQTTDGGDQRAGYMKEARAVISAINLKLLTSG